VESRTVRADHTPKHPQCPQLVKALGHLRSRDPVNRGRLTSEKLRELFGFEKLFWSRRRKSKLKGSATFFTAYKKRVVNL